MFWISHFASGISLASSFLSIEADPALGVPYGNDLHFPGVFGKWYLYVVPEGHFCILELV
jgi:hypothetical protein